MTSADTPGTQGRQSRQQDTPWGTLRDLGRGLAAVRVTDRFATNADDLWQAITTPARLSRWSGEIQGDLREGGSFTGSLTTGWSGAGRVETCEPPVRLVVTLAPGSEDESCVEATLTPDGDATVLVVEERGVPRADVASYGAAWHAQVESLGAHLRGRPAPDWSARWTALTPAYSSQPVLASQEGPPTV